MEDIFYYYQDKISRCLSKSEIYVLQDKIVEEKDLTEEQKDELLDFSWEEIDLIDAKSSECFLFAIDLIERKMIWLNTNIDSNARVTGTINAKCLLKYFNILNEFNLYNVFSKIGTNVNSIKECTSENDIVVVPEITEETAKLKCTVITPQDTEKMLKVVGK